MAKFNFEARDISGKKVKGLEDAASSDELLSRLQNRGLIVTNITEIPEIINEKSAVSPASLNIPIVHTKMHRGVRLNDLVMFSRQLATMLGAGISLLKSLEIIVKQVESKILLDATLKIVEDVKGGVSFHEALARHPKIFSSMWANLVETGEASGNLPLILDRLAAYLEEQAAFRRKMISALIYPAILFGVCIIAIFFFTFKIIPTFADIFQNLGGQMPALTQFVIGFSNFMRHYFFLIFLLIAGGVYAFKAYVKTDSGKRQFDTLLFNLPMLRDFFKTVAVERFTSEISTLVESGVPILYALDIVERSSGNVIMQDIIRQVKADVRDGKSLAGPLEKSNFFAPMLVQMVRVGEEIGELGAMLKKVAAYYREAVETQLTRFTAMFEPLMIVFMGGIVGVLVVSMYLPIFSMVNIGGGR
ncbi:MAG: type II secretion system F family protein [Candidatus Omnitrophota bacterium]